MRWTGLSCNWSPLNCRSLGNCPFFAPTVTTAGNKPRRKKKIYPLSPWPLSYLHPCSIIRHLFRVPRTPYKSLSAFVLENRNEIVPRRNVVDRKVFFHIRGGGWRRNEKNGGNGQQRPSLIPLSSGSGTHPHRGELRLPVDDRLPGSLSTFERYTVAPALFLYREISWPRFPVSDSSSPFRVPVP